jgi:hypothetical protein
MLESAAAAVQANEVKAIGLCNCSTAHVRRAISVLGDAMVSVQNSFGVYDKHALKPCPSLSGKRVAKSNKAGTVHVFRHNFALEDAIGSHACSLEANMRATNGIPLGSRCSYHCHHALCPITEGILDLCQDRQLVFLPFGVLGGLKSRNGTVRVFEQTLTLNY